MLQQGTVTWRQSATSSSVQLLCQGPESRKPVPVRSQGGNTGDKDSDSEPLLGNGVSLHPHVALCLGSQAQQSQVTNATPHPDVEVLPHL